VCGEPCPCVLGDHVPFLAPDRRGLALLVLVVLVALVLVLVPVLVLVHVLLDVLVPVLVLDLVLVLVLVLLDVLVSPAQFWRDSVLPWSGCVC